MIINSYTFAAGPPPGTGLYAEIIADGPVNYWRNGEASGSVMIDEVAADGAYQGAVNLGNPPIYPGAGAPTSATGFSPSSIYGDSLAFPASLTEMTLVAVTQFNSLSGIQPIGIQRDTGGGGRKYQFRASGNSIQFVRIQGGVGVYEVTGVLATGTPYIIGCEVDSAGGVTLYLNGVAQTGAWTVSSPAAADYGGAGNDYQLGYFGGGGTLDGFASENAVFDYVVGPTRQAAYATAAGL